MRCEWWCWFLSVKKYYFFKTEFKTTVLLRSSRVVSKAKSCDSCLVLLIFYFCNKFCGFGLALTFQCLALDKETRLVYMGTIYFISFNKETERTFHSTIILFIIHKSHVWIESNRFLIRFNRNFIMNEWIFFIIFYFKISTFRPAWRSSGKISDVMHHYNSSSFF